MTKCLVIPFYLALFYQEVTEVGHLQSENIKWKTVEMKIFVSFRLFEILDCLTYHGSGMSLLLCPNCV